MTSRLITSPLSATRTPPPEAPSSLLDVLKSVSLTTETPTVDLPYHSPLQKARLAYTPRINPVLKDPKKISFHQAKIDTNSLDNTVSSHFPHLFQQPSLHFDIQQPVQNTVPKKIGVVLSGGPAPGGHNVISGMFDFITKLHPQSKLFGFLDGPDGILKNKYKILSAKDIAPYRNQGGFHMIGSGRTKIETPQQFKAARDTVSELGLDALVVIGGDDSNSNAMKLAENFKSHDIKCCVNGAPKTIDNDLRNKQVQVSFGFDTASKSYAQSIGSLAFDAVSAKKAYHFVRVMGRSASHIALECALQTHPNLCFIGEEVQQNGLTLTSIVDEITNVVAERATLGKNYGVVVLPEGLVEFMPDVNSLISDLNEVLAKTKETLTLEQCANALREKNRQLFTKLPPAFAGQLMLERDPHGNVQVAKIEVERLLISMVSAELANRKKQGSFTGKFSGTPHYLGYEARCCLPTNFDTNYCYGLGLVAAALCCDHRTGYIATLSNLTKSPEEWIPAGFPLTMMMNIERRNGKDVSVIKKMLVDLQGTPFTAFTNQRDSWRMGDDYRHPGGSQFWGPCADDVTISLNLESGTM